MYCTEGPINRIQGRYLYYRPYYRISEAPKSKYICLGRVTPQVDQDRKTIASFPYIDEHQRLRLWDVDNGVPLPIRGKGVVEGGIPPEVLRNKSPRLFEFAQSLGYWLDVKA